MEPEDRQQLPALPILPASQKRLVQAPCTVCSASGLAALERCSAELVQSSVTFLHSHFTYCRCSLFSVIRCGDWSIPFGSPLSMLIKSCPQEENLSMPAELRCRTPELKASRWPVT